MQCESPELMYKNFKLTFKSIKSTYQIILCDNTSSTLWKLKWACCIGAFILQVELVEFVKDKIQQENLHFDLHHRSTRRSPYCNVWTNNPAILLVKNMTIVKRSTKSRTGFYFSSSAWRFLWRLFISECACSSRIF